MAPPSRFGIKAVLLPIWRAVCLCSRFLSWTAEGDRDGVGVVLVVRLSRYGYSLAVPELRGLVVVLVEAHADDAKREDVEVSQGQTGWRPSRRPGTWSRCLRAPDTRSSSRSRAASTRRRLASATPRPGLRSRAHVHPLPGPPQPGTGTRGRPRVPEETQRKELSHEPLQELPGGTIAGRPDIGRPPLGSFSANAYFRLNFSGCCHSKSACQVRMSRGAVARPDESGSMCSHRADITAVASPR